MTIIRNNTTHMDNISLNSSWVKGEVNISLENTTMVVWIYDGV